MTNTLEYPAVRHCSIARTAEDLDDVFRLRYLCYQRRGAVADRADRRFRDYFDDLPNQFGYLVRDEEEQALVPVRIAVIRPDMGWLESPAGRVFGDHPAFPSMAWTSFVEARRLSFAHMARRDSFYGLLGNMAALAERYGVEWLAACPRVEHSEVY